MDCLYLDNGMLGLYVIAPGLRLEVSNHWTPVAPFLTWINFNPIMDK